MKYKLPKPSQYEYEKMTDNDWDFYFRCREKLDKPMSREEINAILDKTTKLDSTYLESPDMDEYFRLVLLMPVAPETALAIKHAQGFKAIQEFNLYNAKQKYPDEF